MKTIRCVSIFLLCVTYCNADRSPKEKWSCSHVVGVWQIIPDASFKKESPCEFVFFEDGSGYASEDFSMVSLISSGRRKRIKHELFWTVGNDGCFHGIMISKTRSNEGCKLNDLTLELEKAAGCTTVFATQRYSEVRVDEKIIKISDIPGNTSGLTGRLHWNNSEADLPSPLGSSIVAVRESTNSLISAHFVGEWSGVTTTWPTNFMFKLLINSNGTGSLEEGFSKTACDSQKIIKHKLFWMADEKGQHGYGLAVAIVKGVTVAVYDFSLDKKGDDYCFILTKPGSDIEDVAKIRKVFNSLAGTLPSE